MRASGCASCRRRCRRFSKTDVKPEVAKSPALSLFARPGDGGVRARRVAILVADGVDGDVLHDIAERLTAAGAVPRFVGSRLGTAESSSGDPIEIDAPMEAAPSVLFDGLVLPDGADAVQRLAADGRTLEFLKDQYRHCKPILALGAASELLDKAGIPKNVPSGKAGSGTGAWTAGRQRIACPGIHQRARDASAFRSRDGSTPRVGSRRSTTTSRQLVHMVRHHQENDNGRSRNTARRVHRRTARRVRRGETAHEGAAQDGEGGELAGAAGGVRSAPRGDARTGRRDSRRCSRRSTRRCAASTATAWPASSRKASPSWKRTSTTRRWMPA